MRKPTKKQKILSHLKSGRTITSMEAIDLYRCTRLAAVIHSLKEEGYDSTSAEFYEEITKRLHETFPHKFKDGTLGFIARDTVTDYYQPEVGDFYIFEASHQHFVMPYKTNDKDPTRRSMSFNFVIQK